ncbi:MAG TPA: primosomal protein N', partial [Parasegetibacter sp.]
YNRRQFFYPPFSRVIVLTFKHKERSVVQAAADMLHALIKNQLGKYIVGPAEPPVNRVRNKFLMELTLKLPKDKNLISHAKHLILQQIAVLHQDKRFRSVQVIPDVDAL